MTLSHLEKLNEADYCALVFQSRAKAFGPQDERTFSIKGHPGYVL